MSVLQAIWPIVDETVPARDLIAEAHADLPAVAARSHVAVAGPGAWSIEPAAKVPGSGNTTPSVLVWRGPVTPAPRLYRTRLMGATA